MDFYFAAQMILALEALACLWLARLSWKCAAGERPYVRAIGPLLALAAAGVILYGLALA